MTQWFDQGRETRLVLVFYMLVLGDFFFLLFPHFFSGYFFTSSSANFAPRPPSSLTSLSLHVHISTLILLFVHTSPHSHYHPAPQHFFFVFSVHHISLSTYKYKMALLDIPSYPEPCLAPTKDNSTVYLVGTPVLAGSNLNVNIVSIDDINAPVIKKKFSAPQSYEFFSDIPRKCSSYLGDTLAEEYSLHIQQVGFDSSWDKMFFAHNGTFRSTGSFVIFSFSKQSYSYIGLAGPYAWALAVITDTRNTIPYSAWGSVFLNLTSGDSHLL